METDSTIAVAMSKFSEFVKHLFDNYNLIHIKNLPID